MKRRILKTIALILTASGMLTGQTWTSVQDGNWNDPATWGSSNYPPANLSSGKHVNINHTVSISSSFASTLSISNGASLNINGGTFMVGTGISMDNRGRFTGYNGSLMQCLFVGCGTSGSQASGVWNTIDGGYTRMENMTIQIAQDWATNNGGRRFMKNSCVKTGQNFSINHGENRDTIISSRFEIGLHGSGNWQQNKGIMIYEGVDIVLSGTSGNAQFSDGSFTGSIRLIKVPANGNIQVSSSVSGLVTLGYYCTSSASYYQDPSNKFVNEVRDCAQVNNLLTTPCTSAIIEEEETPREMNHQGFGNEEPGRLTSIYPNPFKDQLEVNFVLNRTSDITITLYDLTGRKVFTETRNFTEGSNRMIINDFGTLYPGLYFATVATPEAVISRSKLIRK